MTKPKWMKGEGIIVKDAKVGRGTQVWHYVNLFGCMIGRDCIIGSHTEIGKGVVVGNKCKIEQGVFIPTGVVIEDDVFIGPHVVFTNDRFPRATGEWKLCETLVKKGASIGANATIRCGVTIGEGAMVGCGAVVTKDVQPWTVVVGNPARKLHKLFRIVICTPFCNEEHSIPLYMEGLLKIDYPKELIDLVWLENDSIDNTKKLLDDWFAKIKSEYHYHSFNYISKSYGTKAIKIQIDQKSVRAGKNILQTQKERNYQAKKMIEIFNYFFSLTEKFKCDYFLMYMADAVPPPNVIKRYLETFKQVSDAGWVGGVVPRREIHRSWKRFQYLESPWILRKKTRRMLLVKPERILGMIQKGKNILEVGLTGHVFMIKNAILSNPMVRANLHSEEIVIPLIFKLWDMGYKVYCINDIFIKHICLDGKIHKHSLSQVVDDLSGKTNK